MVEELTYDSDKKRPSSSIIILRDAMCHFFILLEQGFFVFCSKELLVDKKTSA